MEQGGQIAEKLAELYSYVINQLYLLNATKKTDIFDTVLKVLGNLKEGWEQMGQGENQEIAQTATETEAQTPAGGQAASVSVQI